jgi:hypothetical protein
MNPDLRNIPLEELYRMRDRDIPLTVPESPSGTKPLTEVEKEIKRRVELGHE